MDSINLINFKDDKMVLNHQALQLIANSNQFISVVSVCGEYRTGKSFLLNSLFSKNCFQVSPTTQACTKGINMMRHPIKCKNKNIWIFDTEGFGSLQQDGKHDAKIFLISMLISQVMIYNSLGAIDQISLSKIGMMCKQAEILANYNQNGQIQQDYLNGNTKFYWILRDFALSLINKQGVTINPDEYLQEAIHTTSNNNETQRKLIRNFFPERHCFPLIRPCVSEQNIHTLKQIGDKSIRSEFLEQIKRLKSSILQNANAKKIRNKKIKGPQFIQLLRCYVQMINEQKFCTSLCLTWQQIQTHQRQALLQKIQEEIRKKYKQYEKMLPLGQDQLGRLQKQIRLIRKQQAISISHNESSIKILEQQVEKINSQLKANIMEANHEKIRQKCLQYLSQYYQQLSNKLVSLANLSNFNQKFEGQISKLKKNYFLRFSSYQSQLIYQQYASILQKLLNNLLRELVLKWCEDDSAKIRKFEQLKKQKKVLQLELEQRMKIEETLGKQLIITKKLYEQSIKNISNYVQIIDRMERVSQNLRKEFQIIKQSQITLKHTLELKIIQNEEKVRNHQVNQQALLQEVQQALELNRQKQKYIEQLKKQMNEDRECHEKDMKAKIEGLMTVLNNERQHFQNIMSEKSQQQASVRKQLQVKQQIIYKIRQQFGESTNYLKAQFHQTMTEMQLQHEGRMKQKQNNMRELYKKNEQLAYKIEKVCADMQNIGQQQQNKSNKIAQIKTKYKQLQNKLSDKQCQYLHKLGQEQHNRNRVIKQNQQLRQNIGELEEKMRTIQKRNKQQLQGMCKKLQQSLSNQEMNSKQKQEYMQKQYEIQRQDIANKLTQAAERIEKMNIKQTKLTNKLHEYEGQIKHLKQELIKYQTQTGQCKMCIQIEIKLRNLQEDYQSIVESSAQLQQIISIQQADITKLKDRNKHLTSKVSIYGPMRSDENLQSCKQILKNQEIEQLKLQSKKEKDEKERQRILWVKKQQSYIQIIQKMKQQKQINKRRQLSNRNSTKKEQEQLHKLSKCRSNKENPQSVGLVANWQGIGMTKEELQIKIQQLCIQNRRIKNQLQQQRETVDKLRKQSIKSINFHAFMKRNKIVDQQNDQSIQSKKNTNTMTSIEFHQKLITKQKVIDELLNKIDELINNQLALNDKINEQRLVLASQYEQIENLKQEVMKQKQHSTQIKKNRQKIRNQLQNIKAQYHLTIEKLQKQIHMLSKKHSNMSKETQLWKMKALQLEERSLVQNSHQNILYKQKIDSLFNKY